MFFQKKTATLIVFLTFMSAWTQAKEYTFAVVPQQAAKKLAGLWGPILQHVSKESGYTIKFTTAKDIPTFEQRLLKQTYDFAYMNPYHYVFFSEHAGYTAVAKRIDQKIQGILVVAKDKDTKNKSLERFKGKELAFPSPAAFAATILPQATLRLEGINFTSKYVSSHDSVYLSVSKGLFSGGGGVKRTFNNTDPKVREKLEILWTTKAYTPHAIAAKRTVPEDVRLKVQAALLGLNNTDTGRKLLKSIAIKNGLEKAVDKDWDDVRGLKITSLDKLLK